MKGYPRTSLHSADILQRHHHSAQQVYGMLVSYMSLNTPVKFTVVGGNNAFGTELMITGGTTIESGDSSKYFDLNMIYVVSVSTANKLSVVEFLYGTAGTEITSVVTTDVGDTFTKVDHGLVNGDKIIITNLTTTTGVVANIVYYVVNMAGNVFQLSLTLGGAAVLLAGGNGTCSFKKISSSTLTSVMVSCAATNSDSIPTPMNALRIPCNSYVFVRAKSETGETISIGFLLGLHTYNQL
jgi:hypothetical protein